MRRGKTRWRVGPLVLSESAGIGNSPRDLARLAMGCSCNGMKMSVVFVSGAQTGRKSTAAQHEARYSTHLIVDNERLELMYPVVPRTWFAVFFVENIAWFEVTGPERCISHDPVRSTDGMLVRTHSGALSTVSCPSLACWSARQCMTYSTCFKKDTGKGSLAGVNWTERMDLSFASSLKSVQFRIGSR